MNNLSVAVLGSPLGRTPHTYAWLGFSWYARPHTFQAFCEKNQDLVAKSPPFLGHYYSPALLAEKRAFDTFVAPDRKPLPGGKRFGVPNLFHQ